MADHSMLTAVLMVILKVTIVYWAMIAGLKLVGRRAFGQIGPHEFILLAFLAKIMSDQIIPKETGLIGNIAAGGILMFYVWLIDRIPALKNFIQGELIVLMKNNILDEIALKRHHITREDLNHLARKHGHESYEVFDQIYLERNGHLSGTFKRPLLLPV